MKSRQLALVSLGLILLLGWGFWRSRHALKPEGAREESPLYTGKEPLRKVRLTFPSKDKPGLIQEDFEIYATQSQGAQVKQVLQLLFKGPGGPLAATAFPGSWKYREVFLTEAGLAVIDLDLSAGSQHPGGTTSEYLSLYTLIKSLTDNFRDVKKVQILVNGQAAESLAGHFNISAPLTLESF